MSNPFGFGIVAALALASVTPAGGNDGNNDPPKSPPPQDGVTITAAPGKGITFKADDFSLNISNRIQVNLGFTDNDVGSGAGPAPIASEDTLGVRIRRARTKLSGDAYQDTIHYVLQFEWADGQTSDINDALIFWDFYKSDNYEMTLRFGQGKTLFGTEATGTSAGLEFVDRALATMVFANTRTRQAQVVGKLGSGAMRWNAGLMNGDVAAASTGAGLEDSNNGATELNWIFGAAYGSGHDEIYGEKRRQGALEHAEEAKWIANASMSYGRNDNADVGGQEYDAYSFNVGGALYVGPMHFLSEVFVRDEDAGNATIGDATSFGWQGSGSYTIHEDQRTQWAFGARLSGVHVTALSAAPTANAILGTGLGGKGDILELSVMASAYYFGHNLKTQFGYTFRTWDPDTAGIPDADRHTIEMQSQIVF